MKKIENDKCYAIMRGDMMLEVEIKGKYVDFVRNKAGVHAWHCNSLLLFDNIDIIGIIYNKCYYQSRDYKLLSEHIKEVINEIF